MHNTNNILLVLLIFEYIPTPSPSPNSQAYTIYTKTGMVYYASLSYTAKAY